MGQSGGVCLRATVDLVGTGREKERYGEEEWEDEWEGIGALGFC